MLVKYLRNVKGEKVGAVVAIDRHYVGWSVCRKGEKFNQEHALDIAKVRAGLPLGNLNMPNRRDIPTLVQDVNTMVSRSVRYFK